MKGRWHVSTHLGVRGAGIILVVLVAFSVASLEPVSSAQASCPQNTDFGIFTVSSDGENIGHGDQAAVTVKVPPIGDCVQELVGEGTAHMHVGISGSGDYAEIGWAETTQGALQQTWLFWEVSLNNAGNSAHLFSSGCAAPGTVTTFRVGNKTGTNQWAMSYACNGGGFTQIALSQDLGESTGDPRGETTHHSNPVPTNGLDDHFQNLQWRGALGNWNLWGGVKCDSDGGLSNFWADVISGHEYQTKDGSGFC